MKDRIGSRLRQYRAEKGLTQKELAARISGGIDYTYIGKIERGEQLPSLKILLKICDALRVPVASFFQDDTAVMLADPHVRKLLNGKQGRDLLKSLQVLHEDDVPLVVEIIRALARHHDRKKEQEAEPTLLAAEENHPYGDR